MNAKTDFVTALQTLPDELKEYLSKTIPALQVIPLPTDEKTATVAQGILAYNINLILKQYEGLPLLPMLLRAGQLNPVFQGILLASLEYIDGSDKAKLDVLTPERGAIYYGWFDGWRVQLTGDEKPVKVTGRVNGETFDFAPSANGLYTGSYPTPIGEHQAYITAELKNDTLEALVGFSVRHWSEAPTIPEDGGTYPPNTRLKLDPGKSAKDVTGVTATIENTTITLTKQDDGSWLSGQIDNILKGLIGSATTLAFQIGTLAYQRDKIIRFGVGESSI